MTRFLLFTILLISVQSGLGQISDSILKISFRYDKGHYTFGSSGRYSISEIIEYSKLNNTGFQITNYIQLRKYYDSATSTITVDTIKPGVSKTSVTLSKTEKLLNELNISRDNFSSYYVKPFLKAPTKREILGVAEKYEMGWILENDNSDRRERRELFRNIRKFSMLDTFLLFKKPKSADFLVVMDVWNRLSITCHTSVDTLEYRSQYFEFLGQPVVKYINKKYIDSRIFVNLEINNTIREYVPANSLISRVVDLNQLKEEYIRWFIDTEF